ncbi:MULTISPECIES: endonuclease/exonuclease/phosphatase family protein [unclassified Mucilaginibacter]|uniref:endonuclease/exonuclease/phosphatase family protein n=1 Tax=unclassified Mucilaginibacter TaxID=2617802 RepID=UPI0031F5FD3D
MNLFLTIYACFLFCCTLLPLVRNDYWIFRVFDYPRLQKLALVLLCLVLWAVFYHGLVLVYWGIGLALLLNAAYLLSLILPFTALGKKQVLAAGAPIPEQSISLMIANVYEFNPNKEGCVAEVRKADPDVVILLEANEVWEQHTRVLENDYAYHVKVPLNNTYGLILYAKLELSDTEVKYLVEEGIPSIHTKIRLPNGQQIQFYAVHPTPPVPNENVRSTERDKELLIIADLAKASNLPVIVAGDLNDVAWSHTTELFLKMSGLLDPRRGRGFFNSFNAHYPFLRFPLDHAFSSTHFKLRQIKRLHNFGSDHFPIFLNLQYEQLAAVEQKPMQPDADEIEEAEEKKAKEV